MYGVTEETLTLISFQGFSFIFYLWHRVRVGAVRRAIRGSACGAGAGAAASSAAAASGGRGRGFLVAFDDVVE